MTGFARLESRRRRGAERQDERTDGAAIGVAVRCEGCIAYHVHDAVAAGATRQELLETIGVACR